MVKGIVFDIQKFSLHDGPGIRTTVFLKGCPLGCIWCANPESQLPHPQLGFNRNKCQHCMTCVTVCPQHVHQEKDGRHFLAFEQCAQCWECVRVCPADALKIYGKEMSVAQVMDCLLKDRVYYEKSGGGMTLSGGEPMQQFDFTLALLRACQLEGINTCLDTCGYAASQQFAQLAPLVDYFLYDVKSFDEKVMHKYVGATHELILQNLQLLDNLGAAIFLRCPLIPGINDTIDHFSKIVEWVNSLQNIIKVHIMPYHDFGRSKAAEIGKDYPATIKTASDLLIKRWTQQLLDLGVTNLEIG